MRNSKASLGKYRALEDKYSRGLQMAVITQVGALNPPLAVELLKECAVNSVQIL